MGQLHQQLLDPSTYPEMTQSVSFKETHISRIYLTDRHVYKLKKPLNLGFLDFSTLEKRHHFCREELRLNRRFTTGVYLDVIALRQLNGRVGFGDAGTVLDYAVRMRRLPEERMLNRLIEGNAPALANDMPRLGAALRALLAKSETCRHRPPDSVALVRQNCVENFRQTRHLTGPALSQEAQSLMESATLRDLDELASQMQEREEAGMVRDGHGDLHTANICMTDPVCIYDCIEFNRRFRIADIAADLAFLIMDLEFLGRADLARALVEQHLDLPDHRQFKQLFLFYKGYRAWVRGKVDALLACDAESNEETRSKARELAGRYFNLALGYRLAPTLFIVAGLMGSGKTTLARALAAACGAAHLRSDVVRKQLAGLPENQACREPYGAGLYCAEMTRRTYAELYKAARRQLSGPGSVIVDASFANEQERENFLALAAETGRPAWLLHVACPDDVAMTRLAQRSDDASDGRSELFAQQKAGFSQIKPSDRVVAVDTSDPVDYNVQSLLCRVLAERERRT